MAIYGADARQAEYDPLFPGRFPENIVRGKSGQCQEKQCHRIHTHIACLYTENRHQQGKCHKIYRNLPVKQLFHIIFAQQHIAQHKKHRHQFQCPEMRTSAAQMVEQLQ